jgi:hypothetical protein
MSEKSNFYFHALVLPIGNFFSHILMKILIARHRQKVSYKLFIKTKIINHQGVGKVHLINDYTNLPQGNFSLVCFRSFSLPKKLWLYKLIEQLTNRRQLHCRRLRISSSLLDIYFIFLDIFSRSLILFSS